MSIREEQCNKVCRILDDVLANRTTERDSLIVAVRKAFESLEQLGKQARLSNRINNLLFKLTHQDKIFTTIVHTNRALQFICNVNGVPHYKCSAGGNLLVILADGTLLPCRRLPITVGNVLEHSISVLVASSEVLKNLREDTLSDECKTCEKCKGGAKCLNYAVTGDYKGKDINCIYNN